MTQLPASGRSAICSGPCNNADMRWEIASIEEFVREVDASACEASNIFEQLEQK